MKIAYLSRTGVSQERGVLKKIASQVRAWLPLVDDVRWFALSRTSEVWEGLAGVPLEVVVAPTGLTALWRVRTIVKQVVAWEPDLVYCRWGQCLPSLLLLERRVPTFFEINTDDVVEYRERLTRLKYIYHLLARGVLLRKARGLVCISEELADKFRAHNDNRLVVPNGIELSQFEPRAAPENPEPRLVCLAGRAEAPWHGIDKIVWLARRFPKWQFDLIGVNNGHLRNYGLDAPSNVTLHGMLGRSEYEAIMAKADIALGTLALHRKNLEENSALKIREYLAFGIPTILGYQDTDFPHGAPFLLPLPNTPGNVSEHAAEIEEFVDEWKGRVVPQHKIAHLDWGFKAKKMLSWFGQLI